MIDFDIKKFSSIHFIGIGGIGISAIARMMLLEGKKVSGSDRSRSLVAEELEKKGAKITIGHDAGNIPADCELVIYTVAIGSDNPELLEAKKRGVPVMTYPEALGLISRDKFTIAISGTSGKTTTTAMIAKIMIDAGLDPTVIVGSLMLETGSNFIAGKSNYLVVEADEYKRAFYNLAPSIFVINNITADHLDYFKDLADIQSAFHFVAKCVPESGFIICDVDDPNVAPAVDDVKCKIVAPKRFNKDEIKLKMFGAHNRMNAAMAWAVGKALGIADDVIIKALEAFSGTWRRFEYRGRSQGGALVYDDYAHNPEKVQASLAGAREYFGDKKIVAIFQPHLYSRTKTLLNEFAKSFDVTDELILLPIYAARESNDPSITSDILAEEINKNSSALAGIKLKKVTVVSTKDGAVSIIPADADVIITIGAGDVTEVSGMLTN